MIPSWKIKIVLSALWQGKQNLPIAGRKHTGHGKSIKKEAEMQVFSRLHGVLNALGCSISRPDISQSNCCHVSWRTSWLERGQRNLPFTSMRLYRSTKPSFSHRSLFTQSQYKARRQLLYRLAWKLRKYLDCFGKKQWIRFVWNAQIHVSNH